MNVTNKQQNNKTSVCNDNLLDLFDFSDEFFNDDNVLIDLDVASDDFTPNIWLKMVIDYHDKFNGNLSFIHLNKNTIFNKIDDIDTILNLNLYDIVMINETKLDDSVPINYFTHQYYHVLRRDRGGES
jgi:hypothetical protein